MAVETEAECLLRTGALYSERLLLRSGAGGPIFLGLKPGAFSVYYGDDPIYHFDLEGRWQRAFADGLHVLKTLDGSARSIDRVREGKNLVLKRRTLSATETDALDERIRSEAQGLLDAIEAEKFEPEEPPAGVHAFDPSPYLKRAVGWDAAAWDRQRSRFRETYAPFPFLPPDSPGPVVLQATVGAGGSGLFGGRPSPALVVHTADEFARHAAAVAAIYGALVAQAKVVFLAGSDVLRLPASDVVSYLREATARFPTLAGVHAVLDRLEPPLPTADGWRTFRDAGLARVILGVESGDRSVRERYGKSWADERLAATVADLKGAGIGVGVVLAVGAGGRAAGDRHVGATADLVNACELGPGDVVSLVDVSEMEARAGLGPPPGVEPLDREGVDAQTAALRDRLAPTRVERRAKVVPYQLDKQGLL